MLFECNLILFLLVDGFYLLSNEFQVVFKSRHFPVHLINKTVTFLAFGGKETQVVFVSLDFRLQSLIPTHQLATFVVNHVGTFLCKVLQVALKVV